MSAARGTTPTFELSLEGVDLTEAKNVYVTFSRFKGAITKTTPDDLEISVTRSDEMTISTVYVFLSQEETLNLFQRVRIQVNWTYANGVRAASDIAEYCFSEQLLQKVVT